MKKRGRRTKRSIFRVFVFSILFLTLMMMFFFHDGGSSEISTSLRLSKKYVQVFPQMKNVKNSEEVLSIKKDVYFTVPMRDVKGCDLFDIPGVERAEIHCSMEPECVGFVTYGNRAYLKNCLGDRVVETLDQHFVLSVKEKHALEISNPSSVETNQRKKLNENRVFWLHIPKTGVPTEEAALGMDQHTGSLFNKYPPSKWCDVEFADTNYGGHWPFNSRLHAHVAVGLFRDPRQRILSAFAVGLHSWGLKNRNKMRNHVKEVVSRFKEDGESLDVLLREALRTYVNYPGIESCQTKMVLGHDCAENIHRELTLDDLEKAKRIVETEFMFVGLTEEFDRSVCLFHAMMGDTHGGGPNKAQKNEFMNMRPTHMVQKRYKSEDWLDEMLKSVKKTKDGLYDEEWLDELQFNDFFDEKLHAHVRSIFNRNIETYSEHMQECLDLAASSST